MLVDLYFLWDTELEVSGTEREKKDFLVSKFRNKKSSVEALKNPLYLNYPFLISQIQQF